MAEDDTRDDDADPYDLAYPSDTPPPPHPAHNAPPHFVQVACIRCGYNLTGVAIGGVCPECGTDVDASLIHGDLPTNGFAITSMVIGIISLVSTCCCPAGLLGVVGLVFGIIALNQISSGNYNTGSRGMAIAGIICSTIALLLGIIGTLLMALG